MPDIFFTSIELGLLYSLLVLGVFMTFRVLDFPDMTVDGSFVTGSAATTIAILSGIPGIVAIFIGFLAGFLAGCITSFVHIKLKVSKILAGILSLSILYTINLRIMNGSNISLLNQDKIISLFKFPVNHLHLIVFLLFFVLLVKLFLGWFLHTEFGLHLRATGSNEAVAQSFAINTKLTKFFGVGISNGLVGLAGGLVVQYQGFTDVNMGIGSIILGLAALMLGEAIFSRDKIGIITTSLIIGSVLYQLIINIALRLGLPGTDLKLATSLIVIVALFVASNKKYLLYGK